MTITNDFQKIMNKHGCKPEKLCVDKGNDFYNKSMKIWLGNNDI